MRTKHILTALALPALFAACTADDFESVQSVANQERAKLSEGFVLNTSNEAETRYSVEGSNGLDFSYTAGDKVGAAIIDQYNPNEKDPAKWDVIYSLAGNNPFKYDGADTWVSETELGVGHYLFVYPYNAKDNNRAAVSFELPRVQQYDGDDLNAIVANNNKAVGAAVLLEGETTATVSMKNLYTYPKFVINFDNGEKITKVTKVVLKSKKGFIYKGGFNHKAVANMFAPETIAAAIKAGTYADKEAYWAAQQTADFIIDSTDDDYNKAKAYGDAETTEYLIVEMDEEVALDSNTKNKYVEVRLVMPSVADFTADSNDMQMYVCTDNGDYLIGLNAANCSFKETTTTAAKQQALWRTKSNTLTLKAMNKTHKEAAEEEGLGHVVTTAADWNDLVATYGGVEVENGLTVSIISSNFAFTSDMDMPKVAMFNIGTPVAVEGEVALSNVTVEKTVTVKTGAVLTAGDNFTAEEVAVAAGGELVFAAEINEKGEEVANVNITKVTNEGVVTVPANVTASFKLANKKDAELNVAGTAVLTGCNYGVINNNGTIEASAFNNCNSKIAGYKYDETTGEYDGVPTVNNNGTFKAMGSVTNNGLIKQNGTLSSNYKSSSNITNTGAIKVSAGKETFIDSNESGVIVLADANEEEMTIYNNGSKWAYNASVAGKIQYAVNEKTTDLSASMVNYLIATDGVNLTKTYTESNDVKALPELEVAKGIVSVAKDAAKVSTMYVNGDVTLKGEINGVTNIVIAKDVTVTIASGAKLAVSIEKVTFGENAEMIVNGELALTETETAAAGKLSSVTKAKQGKISYAAAEKTEQEKLDEKIIATAKNALPAFVETYISETASINGNNYTGVKFDSWNDLLGDNVVTATVINGAINWDSIKEWVTNAIAAWKKAFTDVEIAEDNIPALKSVFENTKTYGSTIEAAVKAVKDAVNISEAVAPDGDAWVAEGVVYVKGSENMLLKDITDRIDSKINMYSDWAKYFDGVTDLSNAEWLTWNDLKNEKKADGETSAYPANIYSYIPAYSYIPTYETSDEYKAVALYNKLANDGEVTGVAYGDSGYTKPKTVTVAEIAKFFDKINAAKTTANSTLYNEATKEVTETLIKTVAAWGYTSNQIAVLLSGEN